MISAKSRTPLAVRRAAFAGYRAAEPKPTLVPRVIDHDA